MNQLFDPLKLHCFLIFHPTFVNLMPIDRKEGRAAARNRETTGLGYTPDDSAVTIPPPFFINSSPVISMFS